MLPQCKALEKSIQMVCHGQEDEWQDSQESIEESQGITGDAKNTEAPSEQTWPPPRAPKTDKT